MYSRSDQTSTHHVVLDIAHANLDRIVFVLCLSVLANIATLGQFVFAVLDFVYK